MLRWNAAPTAHCTRSYIAPIGAACTWTAISCSRPTRHRCMSSWSWLSRALGGERGEAFLLLEHAGIPVAGGVAVDLLKLGAQKAEFDLQGQVAPTVALRASLRNVQPALINVLRPNLLAAGVIDANA